MLGFHLPNFVNNNICNFLIISYNIYIIAACNNSLSLFLYSINFILLRYIILAFLTKMKCLSNLMFGFYFFFFPAKCLIGFLPGVSRFSDQSFFFLKDWNVVCFASCNILNFIIGEKIWCRCGFMHAFCKVKWNYNYECNLLWMVS